MHRHDEIITQTMQKKKKKIAESIPISNRSRINPFFQNSKYFVLKLDLGGIIRISFKHIHKKPGQSALYIEKEKIIGKQHDIKPPTSSRRKKKNI